MAPVATVVICAAGTGSRLGVGVPKCLVSIDGRSIIDRQLDLLEDVPEVRVTVGYREDLVVRHVVPARYTPMATASVAGVANASPVAIMRPSIAA